jgi:small redox-active disulfide protein 2
VNIKLLGPGCTNCQRLEDSVTKAVEQLGIEADIAKVTDYAEFMKYGIMSTPALVVNEEVKIAGRVPSLEEVVTVLQGAE